MTIDREPRKNGANQPDFAQFAHNSANHAKFARIRTITGRLEVHPENSRKCTANDANSASLAQCTGK